MTINTYYLTFGFKVLTKDCLKLWGFTPETMTKETKEHWQEDSSYTEDWDFVRFWFEDNEEFDDHTEGWGVGYRFNVDGKQYIARGFVHSDKKDFNKYYVVGVELGTIDRWDGNITKTNVESAKEEIKTLVQNEGWKKAIQNSDTNCTYYDLIDYGVQHLKYETFSVCPTVYITKDDCDCCS